MLEQHLKIEKGLYVLSILGLACLAASHWQHKWLQCLVNSGNSGSKLTAAAWASNFESINVNLSLGAWPELEPRAGPTCPPAHLNSSAAGSGTDPAITPSESA